MNSLLQKLPVRSEAFFLGEKPLVLVTAAEEDTRRMLRIALEMWNYRVIEARGLEESIVAVDAVEPNVIVMDTAIPFDESLVDMDQIRRRDQGKDVPFILLSGFSQPDYKKAAFEHGARGFLVKPVDWDQLENCIEAVLRKSSDNIPVICQ